MKLLVTGRGSSGSWQIRGAQLGKALDATVRPREMALRDFSAAVMVKRPCPTQVARAHHFGVPIIWDIVDAWPQPEGNGWDRDWSMGWLRQQVEGWRPAAIVAATRAMAADCAEFGVPVLALPHHARPGIARNPIRERVATVGYEGGEQHLGDWKDWLRAECARRGWRFVLNPPALAELDIVVAVRERTGYAPRHWKSNVKLANAQGSGTPIVCARECGYLETDNGGALFADSKTEVVAALDALEPHAARRAASLALRAAAPALSDVAACYRAWIEALPCTAASSS